MAKNNKTQSRVKKMTTKLPETKTEIREKRKFDWRWLAAGIICMVIVITAVIININTTDNSANKINASIAVDNSDLKINWDRYQTVDINLTNSFTITESGTYHLTGAIENGLITIDAGVGEVRLILDNVVINNNNGPAIACYNAENLVIESVGENSLSDGANYASNYDTDVDGVIYSKADLAFSGNGTLKIMGNYADGIVGKDDVVVRDGNYEISTNDDGVRGKDSVYITDGSFVINAGGDGIKSTNDTDYGKGFVMIENGSIQLSAIGKGLKATNSILLYSGEMNLKTTDDAVHTDNHIGIVGGTLTIESGDDGIHANNELIIDGGKINITRSYEGIEAKIVTINDGEISVMAMDDGINAGGGADGSATTQPGAGAMQADANCALTINGGNVYVNSGGDGVDSNGYLTFNGGSVVVDGPVNSGNGSLDSGLGITIQGGKVIAVGAAGMAETLGANSGVCNISVYFTTMQAAGTVIEIRNSASEVVLSHTAAKTFNHMAAGSEALVPGETYTIYVNGAEYQTFTISTVTTTIGNGNVNQHNMPGGQRR